MNKVNPTYRPARLSRQRYRIIYGGAGSGKSVFVAQDELERAASNPAVRTLVVRKVKRTLRLSTFQLLRDVVAALRWTPHVAVNKTEMALDFNGGGSILHAGMDDPEKIKSIAGINRIWIEEANELNEEDFDQLDLRLRGESAVPFQITLTFNPNIPRSHWIRRRFFDGTAPKDPETTFILRTTYRDNPWAGEEYGRVLDSLPEAWRAVYKDGEFYDVPEPDQVIHYGWVKRAFETDPEACAHDGRGRLGVDVARYGDDRTTFARMQGYVLRSLTGFQGQDTNRTASQAAEVIRDHGIDPALVGVDSVGVGAGVVDTLHALGMQVREIKGGASPVEDEIAKESFYTFKNLRSQMWWHMRTLLKEGRLAFAIDRSAPAAQRLVEDLTAPRYRITGDKVLEVEPKEHSTNWGIKNRLGRSTDEGDAVVQATFVERLKAPAYVGFIDADEVFG